MKHPTRRAVPAVTFIAALAVGASTSLLAACSPDEPTASAASSEPASQSAGGRASDPASGRAGDSAKLPTLLTWSADGGVQGVMEAIVSGRLRIDANGCFALGGSLLTAPPGSAVLPGGNGITVPGHGTILLGDRVRGSGGYLEQPPDGPHSIDAGRCLADSTGRRGEAFAVLNPWDGSAY